MGYPLYVKILKQMFNGIILALLGAVVIREVVSDMKPGILNLIAHSKYLIKLGIIKIHAINKNFNLI